MRATWRERVNRVGWRTESYPVANSSIRANEKTFGRAIWNRICRQREAAESGARENGAMLEEILL